MSRGLSWGDIDNDGDVDLVINNNKGPVRLLLNRGSKDNAWIRLSVRDASGKVDQLGTKIEVVTQKGRTLWRRVQTEGSYCSAVDPRVLVGLGDSKGIRYVRAHYAMGGVEEWTALELRKSHVLTKGSGRLIKK